MPNRADRSSAILDMGRMNDGVKRQTERVYENTPPGVGRKNLSCSSAVNGV
jgi:hypothetical protein